MNVEQLNNMSLEQLADNLSDEEKFARAMSDVGRDNFVNAYRNALDSQKDLTFQNLEQSRRNTFQNMMGAANSYGMMYSNFPERAKYQYDVNTYMPARTKTQATYQTGLDTLRNNVTSYLNKLADYDAEIASLNKRNQSNANSNLPTGARALNEKGDYVISSLRGINFYNTNNEPIRFGTVLRRDNITDADQILAAAEKIDIDTAKRLYDVYKKAYEHGYGNFAINAGDNFSPNNLDFLDESERNFMDSLGLTFAQ